jgi:hypothetical protein
MNPPLPVFALLVASALALAMPACNPALYVVTGDAGAAPVDARTDAVGFDLATCLACLETPDAPGPGCETEYDACQADPTCAELWACILAVNCVGGSTATFITCALPCANEAGGIPPGASPLFECLANDACAPVCVAK